MPDMKTALKAIKTLAEVALNTEDTDVLHRHLQLIINVIEKMAADGDGGGGMRGTPPVSHW